VHWLVHCAILKKRIVYFSAAVVSSPQTNALAWRLVGSCRPNGSHGARAARAAATNRGWLEQERVAARRRHEAPARAELGLAWPSAGAVMSTHFFAFLCMPWRLRRTLGKLRLKHKWRVDV
jgi:hypothetical protein